MCLAPPTSSFQWNFGSTCTASLPHSHSNPHSSSILSQQCHCTWPACSLAWEIQLPLHFWPLFPLPVARLGSTLYLACIVTHPVPLYPPPTPPYLGSLHLIKTFLPFPIPKQASQVNLPHSASLSPQLSFFEPLACVRALHFNKPQTDRLLHQSPIPQRRGNPAFPPASGGGLD